MEGQTLCPFVGCPWPPKDRSRPNRLGLQKAIMTTHDLLSGVARLPAGNVLPGTVRSPSRTWLAFSRGACWLLAALLCASCSTGKKPDADWNSLHLWQQVASPPPTYVPTGYGAERPRTDRDGTWFTDQRDGKRLFVPKHAVRGWEPGVLTGEAKKATGFDSRRRLTAGEKAWWGTLFFLGGLAQVQVPPPD